MASAERYIVTKESGSRFAYVIDMANGKTIKKYDIFKGVGKNNGWERADEHARRLNLSRSEVTTALDKGV